MPPTVETRTFSTVFALTLDDHRDELTDQVHGNIPVLWYLRNHPRSRARNRGMGRGTRPYRGGVKVKFPIVSAQNQNSLWISTFQNLSVNPTDEITIGIEELRYLTETVGVSGEEFDQNRGMAAMRDLSRDKMDVAGMTMAEKLEEAMLQGTPNGVRFTAASGGKAINPLGFLVQKNHTTNNDLVHEIAQTDNTFWRNRVLTSGVIATAQDLHFEMFDLYAECSRGSTNDHPDFGVSDKNYYLFYEKSLIAQQRYGNYGDEAAASAGFEALKVKGMVLFWSDKFPNFGDTTADAVSLTQNVNQAGALFLNSRWLELVVSDRLNFRSTPFIEPYNQDAIWAKLLWRGQLILSQRRKFGLHYGVDTQAF